MGQSCSKIVYHVSACRNLVALPNINHIFSKILIFSFWDWIMTSIIWNHDWGDPRATLDPFFLHCKYKTTIRIGGNFPHLNQNEYPFMQWVRILLIKLKPSYIQWYKEKIFNTNSLYLSFEVTLLDFLIMCCRLNFLIPGNLKID